MGEVLNGTMTRLNLQRRNRQFAGPDVLGKCPRSLPIYSNRHCKVGSHQCQVTSFCLAFATQQLSMGPVTAHGVGVLTKIYHHAKYEVNRSNGSAFLRL